jgi:hypothetical protein
MSRANMQALEEQNIFEAVALSGNAGESPRVGGDPRARRSEPAISRKTLWNN